jgi:hypothetical protein
VAAILAAHAMDAWRHIVCDRRRLRDILVAEWNGFHSLLYRDTGAIVGAIMLTAALMGLVFLSSGSGHDEAIDDPFEDEVDR